MPDQELPKEGQEPKPNLPLVPVANLSKEQLWLMYERYNIAFTPPSTTEYQLCTVIASLEALVEDLNDMLKRRS